MSATQLYLASVLIWGSTWLAIRFQLGVVSPVVSVAWRFALAALILLSFALIRKLPLTFSRRQHAWIALQGVLLFGANYVGVYIAEQYLASGLVAIAFSLLVFLNLIGARVFFGARLKPRVLLAALLGVSGVALMFWPELNSFSSSQHGVRGLLIALGSTVFASLGNMAALRNQRSGIPTLQLNGWAMLYGAGFVALLAMISGERFSFDWRLPYLASLLYLALFGSVLAFGAYLTLMKRIGPERAAYTAVAIPIVALLLSSLFEQLAWHAPMAIGLVLCIAGNLLVLRRA